LATTATPKEQRLMTDMPMSIEPIAGTQPSSKAPWDPPRITATSIAHIGSARADTPPPQAAETPPTRRKWGITGDGWLGYPVG
jgi:hypothetical protein